MEIKNFVLNVEEVAAEMSDVFASELTGYNHAAPKLALIFNADKKEYLPGVVVETVCGRDKKFMVYSPLANQMILVDEEGTYLPVTEPAQYCKDMLTADVVETQDGLAVNISVREEEKLCPDAIRAQAVANCFITMNYAKSLRKQYYQMEKKTFKPCMVMGQLNFVLEIEKNAERIYGIFVDVATSNVRTMGVPMHFYDPITRGARIRNKEMKGYKNYFFNGNKFRPTDGSEYLTRAEAEEIFNNLPTDMKKKFAHYEGRDTIPVMCCHHDFSYLMGEDRKATPASVLLLDARIGVITEFNVNVEKTVLKMPVGSQFANDGAPVILAKEGWQNTNISI